MLLYVSRRTDAGHVRAARAVNPYRKNQLLAKCARSAEGYHIREWNPLLPDYPAQFPRHRPTRIADGSGASCEVR
jgi:hypothetical protein